MVTKGDVFAVLGLEECSDEEIGPPQVSYTLKAVVIDGEEVESPNPRHDFARILRLWEKPNPTLKTDFPFAYVDPCVKMGERVKIGPMSAIGTAGFGYTYVGEVPHHIPHVGRVVIGDDVEIGANCSIDRGALDDTVIGDGCKLDNLIQIAHNVRIGEHSALAGCVGVAGSAVIGRRCMIGGGAGILGHLEICDDVVISAMSLVTRSIREAGFYSGVFPLMTNAGWERSAAALRRLPALRERIRALERATGVAGAEPGE